MLTRLTARLTLPAILALVIACDAQQSTAPRGRAASTAEASLSSARHSNANKPTIVLVHGAWADATGWQEVITLLQREGYKVRAVQNPLLSLANDVETTKRVIDTETQTNTVVAVGHSYGGTALTDAAAGNPNVKALVFLSAFVPDAGEPFGAYLQQYPTPLGTSLVFEGAFAYIDPAKFRDVFAGDVPEKETRVMAATQKPLAGGILSQAPAAAAWRTIPSWYLVTQNDQAIHPDLQRFYARRANARITEIAASHVSFISRSREVAKLIIEAAETVSK
jgi:pimeloyl-ACP methyl ester carboxylesterase